MNSPRGLYIHIPFCHAWCGYCDFVTFTGKEDRIQAYVNGVCREFQLYERRSVDTVFFGGGTPSLLEPQQVQQIVAAARAHFDVDQDAEVTLEANPESVTLEKARGWRQAGVNRMSLGLQAYDNALLKAMDRLHTVEQFEAAYQAARAAGFDNINIDLIYGFTGQSLEAWKQTLSASVALAPEHLSLYALAIEEHTPFAAQGIKVDSDLQADMYAAARDLLKRAGYEQYEISNFSKPGRACRHNLIYWRQQDYLGVGVGAVGCVGGVRWQNHKNLPDYFADIDKDHLPRASEEPLNDKTRKFERLMLGLRLREGLEWGEESDPAWIDHRARLATRGLLEETHPGRWRVADNAVPLTNQVLLPFA
jgi:oxygen-independent coproporphyrinogen-3 oxidase